MIVRACFGSLLALSIVAIAMADHAIRVYEVRHRAAAELLESAEIALGEEGRAVLDAATNSIVMSGPPALLRQVADLLRQQDRRPSSILVEAELTTLSGLDAAGYRIEWEAGAGRLKIGSRELDERRAELPASRRLRSRRTDELRSALRILEGEVGRITFGTTTPVRSRGLVGTTVFIGAEAGLLARPTLLPDGRVRLELDSFDQRVDPGGRLASFGASTSTVLEPGETVVLGALERRGESRSARVFSTTSPRTSRDEVVVLLRVEVEGDEPAPRPRP